MARPRIDPKKKKIAVAYRLPRWMVQKMRDRTELTGTGPGIQIEEALKLANQWEEPNGR